MKTHHKLLLLSVLPGFTLAQSPTTMPDDLRALLQQATANYPVLKQQEQQIQAAGLQADIARTALRPQVAANGSYLYLNPVAKATLPVAGREVELQFQPNHNINANISVSQSIYDFGRTSANIQRAGDNLQVQRRQQELTRHNLTYQVAAAYYGIGYIRTSLVVQDSVIRTAAANVRILGTRLQNGDALQYDVLSQQVRLKTAQNRKIDLQNQLDRQLALLTYLTGQPNPDVGAAAQQFGETVQPFNIDGQLQTALATNKDVLAAQDRVRVAQTDIRIDELSGRPSIGFSGNTGYRNGYVPDVNQLRFNVAAGVSVTAPIYAGKRYRLQNQAAKYTLSASQYAVENASAQLRQQLAQLNADIVANQTRLQNLDTQVLQARKALELAQTRLRNGVITTVELESAETGIEEAQLGQVFYQYQLLLNQLEIKRLLGETL
ncbi:TolC family protein [Fibrella sp. HMF5335]|uniref:TolC family protein n=1 Tax=Fibrella rubiginis TaxID=2817060 RepID=A0A939GGM0_9BACT|nr:TolC family protein [Fibrella rubiginis]MBO0937423.1 TolC family protein [Fibrella rubiginis]